eukprot:snap_masked-scaffold_24-processed-gene-2.38-mRNA-1 protein AED:1.00 eAED:1.00 QI:0/0/0/0/1/1/2/0/78
MKHVQSIFPLAIEEIQVELDDGADPDEDVKMKIQHNNIVIEEKQHHHNTHTKMNSPEMQRSYRRVLSLRTIWRKQDRF